MCVSQLALQCVYQLLQFLDIGVTVLGAADLCLRLAVEGCLDAATWTEHAGFGDARREQDRGLCHQPFGPCFWKL